MIRIALRLSLFIMVLAVTLRADPENLLVEGYTFSRAHSWIWVPPDNTSSAVNRFVVPSSRETNRTDIRFFVFRETPDQAQQRLRSNFEPGYVLKESSTTVNETKLTFTTITGLPSATVIAKGIPHITYKVVGVCLPLKSRGKCLLVRLYGPPDEVDPAVEDFKKMIEVAVEEASK